MEPIVVIVGFLGAGKTTLLTKLIRHYQQQNWQPFVILNDYEYASIDAQQLTQHIEPKWINALSGSCICCSGINQLREMVNRVPPRLNGITLIEANGTSDACALMGFLGVGLNAQFLPPVQISVVDVKNWQLRQEDNPLEANQIQVSSLIVLTHLDGADPQRQQQVIAHLNQLNPSASVITMDELDIAEIGRLVPSLNHAQKLDHQQAHWGSCSIDLPTLPDQQSITELCQAIPAHILRVKGCVQVGDDNHFTYFQRMPDGELDIRRFYGSPIAGAKLLIVGAGSHIALLENAIAVCFAHAQQRAH